MVIGDKNIKEDTLVVAVAVLLRVGGRLMFLAGSILFISKHSRFVLKEFELWINFL